MGISPDIIVAARDQPMDRTTSSARFRMFCTVPEDCVIENRTLPVLYRGTDDARGEPSVRHRLP